MLVTNFRLYRYHPVYISSSDDAGHIANPRSVAIVEKLIRHVAQCHVHARMERLAWHERFLTSVVCVRLGFAMHPVMDITV